MVPGIGNRAVQSYAYAGDDPVNESDPTGLASQTQWAWTWSVSEGVLENRLATEVHAPWWWKVAGQSFAGRYE